MSMVTFLAKKIFKKIFTNLATELGAAAADVQLGIYYRDNEHKYEAYLRFNRIKDIELDDYCGSIVDFSGGTAVIDATIAQSGPRYAKELGCDVSDIKIIMQHNEATGIPNAVLMNGKNKVRRIDIEKEFLTN